MTKETQVPAPVTYFTASAEPWPGQRERFDELDLRHHMTRSLEILKARGEYDPARHPPEDAYAPLSLDERLELLACGEVIARHYRHPALVHYAVLAGATWQQIADAVDTTEEHARAAYRQWAESQHRLWAENEGRYGLNEAEYAAALDRAGTGDA